MRPCKTKVRSNGRGTLTITFNERDGRAFARRLLAPAAPPLADVLRQVLSEAEKPEKGTREPS